MYVNIVIWLFVLVLGLSYCSSSDPPPQPAPVYRPMTAQEQAEHERAIKTRDRLQQYSTYKQRMQEGQ